MGFQPKNRKTIETKISAREPFEHSNMSGKWHSSESFRSESYGILPQETVSEMRKLLETTDLYVIYSYRTPIAYAYTKEIIIPNHKYSMTTSNHQSIVRSANR
jgi:hypothetical protein